MYDIKERLIYVKVPYLLLDDFNKMFESASFHKQQGKWLLGLEQQETLDNWLAKNKNNYMRLLEIDRKAREERYKKLDKMVKLKGNANAVRDQLKKEFNATYEAYDINRKFIGAWFVEPEDAVFAQALINETQKAKTNKKKQSLKRKKT